MRQLALLVLLAFVADPALARALVKKQLLIAEITGTETSDPIDLETAEAYSVQAVVDVNTPSAAESPAADVSAEDDTVTEAAHGFFTGLKGQFTTDDTLPAGLSAATDYFIIKVDADTYKVATSLANATAGTAVDITDQGVGNHTFTPTSLAGAAVKVEKSNSTQAEITAGTATWEDVAAATSITADAEVWFEKDRPTYRWIRLHYTLTAGSMSTTNNILVK